MRIICALFALLLCLGPGAVVSGAGEMVEIPAGPFTRGNGGGNADTPEQRAYLEAYAMDRHEVTNAEYAEVFTDHFYPQGADEHPVTRITWYQANSYCFNIGKRLPSEAEWEKAARGNLGNVYPWGNQKAPKPPHPFYSGVVKRTAASDRQDVSAYGVHDMAGSVWEWTSGGESSLRAVRGGLWNLHLDFEYSKAYERTLIPPNEKLSFLGFRCARTLP